MDLLAFKQFFFYCLMINLGLYLFTVVAYISMKSWVVSLQTNLFGLAGVTVQKEIYRYIARFKLGIIIFNMTPWVALVLITKQ